MEVEFSVSPALPGKEILTAELSEKGFEGFWEKDNLLCAYIPLEKYNEKVISSLPFSNAGNFKISYRANLVKHINWNEEWEKNFEPVIIARKCLVRAAFHKVPGKFEYEIVIQPKMSFGTGHHETTSLMMACMISMGVHGFKNRTVLDAGCGSGILSILASKMQAKQVMAVDNDEWAYYNAKENIALNHSVNIIAEKGDASVFGRKKFNIILANINKNFLLENMGLVSRILTVNGLLLLSGFYKKDLPEIKREAGKHCLKLLNELKKNRWSMAVFKKDNVIRSK